MMNSPIDQEARQHLARLARRLAAGAISNEQFENQRPNSREAALHDIYFHGLWPLYDDFIEHRLVGKWALGREERTQVARILLFLRSGLPYRYSRTTGLTQAPVILLSLVTLGWFGRFWYRRSWRGGDESVWPFYTRNEYDAARQYPVFLNGSTRLGSKTDR